MAVESLKSRQIIAKDAGQTVPSYLGKGKVMVLRSSPPVAGTYASGDANSTIALLDIPAGKHVLVGYLSKVMHSAFGAGRTLDIGWDAYTKEDGTAVVADEDGIHSIADVSAAGSFVPLDELGVTQLLLFDSRNGVRIRAKVEAAVLTAGMTVEMILFFID